MTSPNHGEEPPLARDEPARLDVVEPSLRDQTGHCYSFLRSLLLAERDPPVRFDVWIGSGRDPMFADVPGCTVHRRLGRALRRWRALGLYAWLLGAERPTLIATASNTDFLSVLVVARRRIREPGRVFAYVHWFRPVALRRATLRLTARRHPGLEIICSTDRVASIFRDAGFDHVRQVPYPYECPVDCVRTVPAEPTRILYAGAARDDKGFRVVVDLVALLRDEGATTPVTVQCSPTHRGRHTPGVQAEVDRLRRLGYPDLTLIEETVGRDEYHRLFHGAVTIQPYDRRAFEDRISGVTLDALAAGSPLVVPAGTWMARQVERFDAGVTLADPTSLIELREAVARLVAGWTTYAANAVRAAPVVAAEHDPRHLLAMLT